LLKPFSLKPCLNPIEPSKISYYIETKTTTCQVGCLKPSTLRLTRSQ